MEKQITYKRLMEVMYFESDDSNFKVDFKVLTKKYGRDFVDYCKIVWESCKEFQTEEEFCKMNGNIPKGFFDKVINK